MTIKLSANAVAYVSIICTSLFWLGFALSHIQGFPKIDLPGMWWLGIAGVAVILAGVAAARRSKLSLLAIPFALATFLLIIYIIGS